MILQQFLYLTLTADNICSYFICISLGPPVNKQKMYDHIHLQDLASQPTISRTNDVSIKVNYVLHNE